MAQNEIKDFLAALKSIAATESDDREILKRVVPLAKRIVKNPDWTRAMDVTCPFCKDHF